MNIVYGSRSRSRYCFSIARSIGSGQPLSSAHLQAENGMPDPDIPSAQSAHSDNVEVVNRPLRKGTSILFRVNSMEARRMTGRQQLRIGTDDGQPQRLEFQRKCQMQYLW